MNNNKQMEIIISIKDQFTKGIKDMGKSFNRVIEETKELNKGISKTNEAVVVQLEKMNQGFKKTDKTIQKTKTSFNGFKKTLNGVGKAITNTKNRIGKLTGAVFSLKSAFVGLGIGLVGKSFINAASSAENYMVRLTTLLGSQEASAQAFKNTADYARTVSHQFEELLQSSTTLAGVMHKGTEQIKEWLPLIGDLAAVSGLSIQDTTSNFIRMYSAGAAAADLFRERGILALLGIQAKTQYTVQQTRKILMEAWEDPLSKFRDAAKDLSRTWSGLISMMQDRWFLFRLSVMESDIDIFGSLKAALALIVDKMDEMHKSGELTKWAEKMSEKIIDSFKRMALGIASVYDVMSPIMNSFKKMFVGLWDWFKGLDPMVQKIGIVGVIMLGAKGKGLIAVIAAVTTLEKSLDNLGLKSEEITKIETGGLQTKLGYYKRLLVWQKENEKGTDDTIVKIQELERELSKLTGTKIDSIIDSEKIEKDAESAVSIVLKTFEDIEKKRLEMIEGGKKTPRAPLLPDTDAPAIKVQAAELAELKANLSLYDDMLEGWYQEGLKSFDEYWIERNQSLTQARDAEIALLEQMVIAAEDPTKKLAAETKLHVIRQQYAQERIALLAEETQGKEELANKEQEFFDLMNDIKTRAIESGAVNIEEKHIQEMMNLDRRHEEELEKIREQSTAVVSEEEKKQALLEAVKNQEIERENKLAKQKKEILQTQLKNASTIAGGMKGIATELYEMSGKNNKKMFQIAKVAAIAQAIINGALAVSKANDGTYMGYAKMAIAAAMAGIQVAKIRQTEMGGSFAEGGEIPGHSPHSKADDHQINVTSGEYVHPVSAVKYYGKRVMDGIRSRAFPPELFSGFSLPSLSYAGGGRTNFAEGGSIQALTKVAQNAPKIEIINVSNPDTIKGLAMDAVHQNRDIVVNMVLQSMEEKNITLQRDL